MSLSQKIDKLSKFVGNTSVYKLDFDSCNLYAKLEYNNFMGSIKDRPALYAFKEAIKNGQIDENTTIVESSSGNFAMGLAGVCKCLGLKFIAVVDPNITWEKEKHLTFLAHKIVKVQEMDTTGGYLLTRIQTVKKLIEENDNYFSINQYSNPNNYMSYYHTMGEEIINKFSRLDYLFVAVSTGGTVTGLSLKLKEKFPNLKVIAVDIEGSLAFGTKTKERSISGLGSSRKSEFLEHSKVDDFLLLSQDDIIEGCNELLADQMLFAGGSSGAVYKAAKNYLQQEKNKETQALIICPDRGHAYIDIIYKKKKEIKAKESKALLEENFA